MITTRHSCVISGCCVALLMLVATNMVIAQDAGPYVPLQKETTLPPAAPTQPKTYKNLADFLSSGLVFVNDKGVALNVQSQLEKLQPNILRDLEFVGPGGVLVVARLEVRQTDAGPFRKLVSDRVDYVGVGATPADAELSRLGRSGDPFYVVSQGAQIDPDNSTAYWFRRNAQGDLVVGEQSLTGLRRATLSLFADRELNKFDWELARSREVDRLIKSFGELNVQASVRAELTTLADNRTRSLDALKELNQKLAGELKRAAKAAETAKLLNLLYMGASFVDFASKASEGLPQNDQQDIAAQTSKEGVLSQLDAIDKEFISRGTLLREEIRVETNKFNDIETQVILILRQNRVPTENLPPAKQPSVNKDALP